MIYIDRQDAGKQLATKLLELREVSKDVVVLALPRGGVVLGYEVAKALVAPLGIVLVRKIGHPYSSEYAIGAVAENGVSVYDASEVRLIDRLWLRDAEVAAQRVIAQRKIEYYGRDLRPVAIKGKTAIVIDDGIATGLTMRAAIESVRKCQPKKLIVAVPIGPKDVVRNLKKLADKIVVLESPEDFMGAIGAYYKNFEQVSDEEVKSLLKEARNDLRKAIAKSRPVVGSSSSNSIPSFAG